MNDITLLKKVHKFYIKKQRDNLDQTRNIAKPANTLNYLIQSNTEERAMPQTTQTSNWNCIHDDFMPKKKKKPLYIQPHA